MGAVLIIALYPLFFLAPPFPTYGFAEVEQVLNRLSSPGLERTLFLAYQDISFVAALLLVFLFVALHRILRQASPGFALAGTALGLVGSVLLALSFLTARGALLLADLYADPAADTATVLIVAETLDGLLVSGLVATALLVFAVALIAYGIAMRGDSRFWRGYGTITLALGSVVVILELVIPGAGTTITNPPMISWFLLAGLGVYRLSRG